MLTDITGPRPAQLTTVAPVTCQDHAGSPVPEFCRLPRSGQRCPISGLSRSKLNELTGGEEGATSFALEAEEVRREKGERFI